MGKKWKSALGVLAFLLIFALLFSGASYVLRDKRYAANASVVYAIPRNTADVLFAGSSHMLNGVYPMEVWDKSGIASCNIAQNGQIIPETYYALMEAFRYQSPKVVVLDVYKMVESAKMGLTVSFHFTVDSMRPGIPKLRAIFDLVPPDERAEYLVDLIAYHTRWKELAASDFEPLDTELKGSEMLFSTASNAGYVPCPESETAEINAVAADYLQRIADLCEKHRAKLLLVALPFADTENDGLQRQQTVNAVEAWAKARDIPFLNYIYLMDETGIDLAQDYFDNYHLNWRGAVKISDHLAEYLKQNCDLPDRRGQTAYASWSGASAAYQKRLAEGAEK
jgi:hypothetical protein